MATDDDKALYSKLSNYYVENHNIADKNYNKSLERERKHNNNWNKQKVNINEIIDEFTPDYEAKEYGSKLIFYGNEYNVITDMVGGYLRIYSNTEKCYVKLDGCPGNDRETHFKIKKREEM